MHISTRLILGGSQENTVLSCEGQAALGHDVALVFGPIYGPEGSLLERVAQFRADNSRTIQCIETPHLVRELNPVSDLRCYFELRTLIGEWRPEVVHTHSSKAGILGRLAAWHLRVPCVIHTVHGPPFHSYEKRWRNAVYIRSERLAATRCHKIACVAAAMRDQFLAHQIGRPDQYEIVYSGMDVEPYVHPSRSRAAVRRQLNLRDDQFVVGTVARLAELKGHDDLLDALGPLMQANPAMQLLWVGDGWWRKRLLERIAAMGLRDRVTLTGLVRPEQIPILMQAMDVLVHPSYREGLPRTVTQASLSALPTIAYDVDGTREVCIDGETGLLLKPHDLQGLRRAVEWMMSHAADRIAMGHRGREHCRTRFAARTMVEHLDRLYQSVLSPTRQT